MAGLLYTNQTHKQLFISFLVPPYEHQFSLYPPSISIPLMLHPNPHPLSKPSVPSPSSHPSLPPCFDHVPKAGQGTQLVHPYISHLVLFGLVIRSINNNNNQYDDSVQLSGKNIYVHTVLLKKNNSLGTSYIAP